MNSPSLFSRVTHLTPLIVLILSGVTAMSGCNKNPITSITETFSPPSPTEAVQDTFNPFDPDRRRRGLALLASSDFGGDELYVRTYRTLLTDQDATVRAVAAQALGLHGVGDDAVKIVPLLEDESDVVRWEAAKALQKLHHKDVIVPLSKRLRSDTEAESDVRQACAAAMGQYQTEYAFEALVNTLHDNDFGVVRAARDSLQTLTGTDLGSNAAEWLRWAEDNKSNLFASGQPYTWKPFAGRRSVIQKLQFWKDREEPAPRTPTGLESSDEGADDDSAQSKS